MIDYTTRQRYQDRQSNKNMTDSVKSLIQAGLSSKGQEDTLKMVFEKKDDAEVKSQLGKIGQALVMIYKAIPKITLPKTYYVEGQVEVSRQSPVQVKNLSELEKYFKSLENKLNSLYLAIQAMPQPQIKMPKIEIPAHVKNDNSDMIAAIEVLGERIDAMKGMDVDTRLMERLLQEIAAKPVYQPTPVTNISINPLQGFVKTTATTVGTTPISMPGYGQLFNRRSLQIYNNSGNTIYYGGSDVTVNNGIPIAANSFSQSIDAGYNMIVYAVAAQAGNNVRVIEVSKDQTANVQE